MSTKRCDPLALKELVDGSGLSPRSNRVSWIFTCPHCSKPKLFLRKRDGRFICWRCATTISYQGPAEYALRDLLGLSVAELQKRLYGEEVTHSSEARVQLPDLHDFFDVEGGDVIPAELLLPPETFLPFDFLSLDDPCSIKGKEYLARRGIPLELAQRLGILYHPLHRRVIFPIVAGGKLRGWQARTVEDGVEPKILTHPEELQRNRVLMFQDSLQTGDTVVVCEGPVDGIKAHLCGPVVVTMGKSMSLRQIDIVLESGVRKVYLGLDPDAADELTRLCKAFSELEVYRLLPAPGYEDLGEMSPEAVLEQFRRAPRVRSSNVFLPPLSDTLTCLRC